MGSAKENLKRAVFWEAGIKNIEQGISNLEVRIFAALRMTRTMDSRLLPRLRGNDTEAVK